MTTSPLTAPRTIALPDLPPRWHAALVDLPLPPIEEDHLWDPRVEPIIWFRGPYRFLSNYMPAPFYDADGRLWASSEHRFNALKTLDPTEQEWVASAPDPAEAKKRGNNRTGRLTLRPDWDTHARYDVMAETLYYKFTAHPGRTQALLNTGKALLVEGNSWDDQLWGHCLCGKVSCGQAGQNHLGLNLMRLRDKLRRVSDGD